MHPVILISLFTGLSDFFEVLLFLALFIWPFCAEKFHLYVKIFCCVYFLVREDFGGRGRRKDSLREEEEEK